MGQWRIDDMHHHLVDDKTIPKLVADEKDFSKPILFWFSKSESRD